MISSIATECMFAMGRDLSSGMAKVFFHQMVVSGNHSLEKRSICAEKELAFLLSESDT